MLTLPAPAKLNLFLHITGQRPDGYHTLQTLFQFIDLHDELSFTQRDDGEIRLRTNCDGIGHEENLVVHATRLLQRITQTSFGADIVLEKRLPIGAGLGGGSSDAATTLVGLNALWDCGLSMDELARLGLQLGADIPVFVHGQAAWAEGVGERLTPIDLPEPWYLILVPPCAVSTREIFSDTQLTRNTPPITIEQYYNGQGTNGCESVVRRRYPAVNEALDWLSGFVPARMTGTGCAVFGAFETRQSATQVAEQLPEGRQGFVAQGRNSSLLHNALAQWGVAKW